jgi:hypothetical protein
VQKASGGCNRRTALLKTLAAKHRTALGRLKGNRGLFAAMRAVGARLNFLVAVRGGRAYCGGAFRFARLAALGFVLELFVVKEELFARGEKKFRAAIDALQQPVLEFHCEKSPFPLRSCTNSSAFERGRSIRRTVPNIRFGPPSRLRDGLQRKCAAASRDKRLFSTMQRKGPLL